MTTRPPSKTAMVILSLCVIGTLGAAANFGFTVHSVAQRGNDAQLLSSADKAYLFIKTQRQGWSRSPLQFVGDWARRKFGIGFAGPGPSKTSSGLVVVVLSPSGVRTIDLGRSSLLKVGTAGKDIYGLTTEGLLRWGDDRFEKAPAGIDRNDLSSINFTNLDGWSGRSNVLSQPMGDTKFELTVGGDRWTVIAKNHSFPEEWKAVDVQRDDAPTQNVWRVDQRMRYVSKEEFDAFLK